MAGVYLSVSAFCTSLGRMKALTESVFRCAQMVRSSSLYGVRVGYQQDDWAYSKRAGIVHTTARILDLSSVSTRLVGSKAPNWVVSHRIIMRRTTR